MKLKFGKDILIAEKDKKSESLDLINFEEKTFFKILELLVENKGNCELKKEKDCSPLSLKFYEIFERKMAEITNSFSDGVEN